MLSTRMRGNQLELNCNNSKIKQQQQENKLLFSSLETTRGRKRRSFNHTPTLV